MRSIQCWFSVFLRLRKWGWPLWCRANRGKWAERWPSSTERSASPKRIRRETSARKVSQQREKWIQSQCSTDRFAQSKLLEKDYFRPPSILSPTLKSRGKLCYRFSKNRRESPLRGRLNLPHTQTQGSVWKRLCRSTPLSTLGPLCQPESWCLFPTAVRRVSVE